MGTNTSPNGQAPGRGAGFINTLDDDFLGCRTQGHRFPKLRPGRIPANIRLARFRDGAFQLTFICPDCGTEKTRTTLPGGGYNAAAHNSYRYPNGYQSPRGSGLKRSDFIDEDDRRILPFAAEVQQ